MSNEKKKVPWERVVLMFIVAAVLIGGFVYQVIQQERNDDGVNSQDAYAWEDTVEAGFLCGALNFEFVGPEEGEQEKRFDAPTRELLRQHGVSLMETGVPWPYEAEAQEQGPALQDAIRSVAPTCVLPRIYPGPAQE